MPKAKLMIWTKNAIDKMRYYKLSKKEVAEVFEKYQRTQWSIDGQCTNFYRETKNHETGVMARQKKDGYWLIISAWTVKQY